MKIAVPKSIFKLYNYVSNTIVISSKIRRKYSFGVIIPTINKPFKMQNVSYKIIPFFLTLFFNLSFAQSNSSKIELNKIWKFRQAGKTEWLSATVPGSVHTDLLDNDIIKDPFHRVNEKELQWIGEKDWEYKTEFEIDKATLKKDNVKLVFTGLDTYADVYVNEKLVLSTDNQHRTWETDSKSVLKRGKNIIRIYFHNVFKVNMPKYLAAPFKLQAWGNNDQNSDIWLSLYTRKAGYQFGWDWGPRLITSGIWRPAYIEAWDNSKIEAVQIIQNEVSAELAKLTAVFEIESNKKFTTKLDVQNDGKSLATKEITVKKGLNKIPVEFKIENPNLWWTNGLGEQHMYDFDCKMTSKKVTDHKIIKTGIRSLKIVHEKDKDGKSLYVELNGVPVFMKGANYIPHDNFQNRVTAEKYEYYIKAAAESNFNMLRVWGGGNYETDYFYELCDRYGILVWQDVMFACGMFPADPDFIETVTHEVKDNFKRIRNHPSIAMYCGNNENEMSWYAWGWKNKYSKEDQATYEKNLHKLFYEVIPNAIKQVDETRYYHPTSPNSWYTKDGNKIPEGEGDVHFWNTKNDTPLEEHNTFVGRFMSEYGFQSYPDYQNIKKFTNSWDRSKTSEVMFAHNRALNDNTRDPYFGTQAIERKMIKYYGIPENFENYVYTTQILHAKATKIAIESHRRHMPYTMGTLYWQLNDTWPAVSWSSIDFYGKWKAAQYMARDVCRTYIASTIIEDNKFKVYIVSDSLKNVNAKLSLNMLSLDGEKQFFSEEKDLTIDANTSKVYFEIDSAKITEGIDVNNVVLNIEVKTEDKLLTDNNYYFTVEKNLSLTKPNITVKSNLKNNKTTRITLKTDVLAKNVYLAFPEKEGHFSDNYFDLLPGQEKVVTFTCTSSVTIDEKELVVKSFIDMRE